MGDLAGKKIQSSKIGHLSATVVGWSSWEEATLGPEGCGMGFGMLISKGTIEFIRQGRDAWERSGIVLDQLPPKVLCCASLWGFVGQAFVSIEEVSSNGPLAFVDTSMAKHLARGTVSPWTAWPAE